MKNYLDLTRFVCLTEISQAQADDRDDIFDKMAALEAELKPLLEKYGLTFAQWESTDFSREKYSIERCEQCEHWLVNRSQNPAGLGEDFSQYWQTELIINDGAEFQEKILCEQCLPRNHRWGCG